MLFVDISQMCASFQYRLKIYEDGKETSKNRHPLKLVHKVQIFWAIDLDCVNIGLFSILPISITSARLLRLDILPSSPPLGIILLYYGESDLCKTIASLLKLRLSKKTPISFSVSHPHPLKFESHIYILNSQKVFWAISCSFSALKKIPVWSHLILELVSLWSCSCRCLWRMIVSDILIVIQSAQQSDHLAALLIPIIQSLGYHPVAHLNLK